MGVNAGGVPGGHAVQAEKTAAALAALGLDVEVGNAETADLADFDVLHAFGLPRPTLRRARLAKTPIVMSSIYWRLSYVMGEEMPRSRLSLLVHAAQVSGSVFRRGQRQTAARVLARPMETALTFELVDLLLPNSEPEADDLRKDLGVTTPTHVVPNAVDPEVFRPSTSNRTQLGVLCVARMEPHKNQLGLIKELRGTGIPLHLAGPEHPDHPRYADAVRRSAGPEVTVHGAVDEATLVHLFQSSEVHVLPSWFETTGLVSLEAALCENKVVTTSRGYASAYFGDLVQYCDPGQPGSIRSAVQTAISQPFDGQLRQHVLDNYTWQHTAKETLRGYEIALASAARS